MRAPVVIDLFAPLFAATNVAWHQQPLFWALALSVVSLVLVAPSSSRWQRIAGGLAAGVAGALFVVTATLVTPQSPLVDWIAVVTFVILAATAVGSAVAMVASRSAVYSAIWFALTLLATGGLFLFQGASFLGVATIVVYAGAIVVTFLFVIMLAQPDGHASYDRISWGWFAKPAAALAGALILGAVLVGIEQFAAGDLRSQVALAADQLVAADSDFPLRGEQVVSAQVKRSLRGTEISVALRSNVQELSLESKNALAKQLASILDAAPARESSEPLMAPITLRFEEPLGAHQDLQAEHQMAHLGGFLFSRHLIAVEVAGTLLLVALVGAIAMLAQSPTAAAREGDAHV